MAEIKGRFEGLIIHRQAQALIRQKEVAAAGQKLMPFNYLSSVLSTLQ
jgi:hypothetical protein